MDTDEFVAALRKPIYVLTMAQPLEEDKRRSIHDPVRRSAMKRALKARQEIRMLAETYIAYQNERSAKLAELSRLGQQHGQ